MQLEAQTWLKELSGWLGADAYSTAWVATVPDVDSPQRPAWPQTLDYLRSHQLEDGGWGESAVYFAHERTISTLAAIMALDAWSGGQDDRDRIGKGLAALRRYAADLSAEPNEPIGFELLLPRLRALLAPTYGPELPLEAWAPVDALSADKLARIQAANPDPTVPQAWWFSMELLKAEQFSQLDDSMLDAKGSVATSTAATAAYLRARRLAGTDSPRAAGYLDRLLDKGRGSVPVGWPFEVFELVWVLDALMRAGLDPSDPEIARLAGSVRTSWEKNEPGLAYSDVFGVNDGDDTLVGFAVLNWAGMAPSEDAILSFWNGDYFLAYLDERGASPSVNIHALTALRSQPGFPHRDHAERVTEWLKGEMKADILFDDKWHISPYYCVAHAIPAMAGWDDEVALTCTEMLVKEQRRDGGWGCGSGSTLEETAHCVLALGHALRVGLLLDDGPLMRAASYFRARAGEEPVERLWIGKTLYFPGGIVKSTLEAARVTLERLGYGGLL